MNLTNHFNKLFTSLTVLSLLTLVSCKGEVESSASKELPISSEATKVVSNEQTPAQAAPEQQDPNMVAALINGQEIKISDIDEEMKRNPGAAMMLAISKQNPSMLPRIRKTLLQNIIDRQLLLDAAKASKVEINDEELNKTTSEIMARMGGQDAFKKQLEQLALSQDQFNSELRRDITIKNYVDKFVLSSVNVSDEDLKKEFEKNPTTYDQQEQVRARHILLKTEATAKPEDLKAIETKANEIYASTQKKDSNFAELAKTNSQDNSASNGGDLGFFGRGMMVPEFEQAAFALKVGEVSKPVKSQFGYHIIKLEEKKSCPKS